MMSKTDQERIESFGLIYVSKEEVKQKYENNEEVYVWDLRDYSSFLIDKDHDLESLITNVDFIFFQE